MKRDLKEACKECPFRKEATPGQLGGDWTALELHKHVMGDEYFPCHQTMQDKREEDYSFCIGALQYRNKNGQASRDLVLMGAQNQVKSLGNSDILSAKDFLAIHKS
ncbi:MAG: hypothetical protein V4714_10795 [Bacteroidota bacterium]